MPCMKCANGKWKYGEHGNCQFDTLKACQAAAAAIHIQEEEKMKPKSPAMPKPAEPKTPAKKPPKKPGGAMPMQPEGPHVPAMPSKPPKGKK